MRVLNFGKYWRKDGGIETHVKSLCKGLAGEGVEVVNIVSSIDNRSADFEIDGYRVIEVNTLGIHFGTSICPKMAIIARQLHKVQPFDVIHLHFPDPMSHLASMMLPAPIPRVITWHSDIVKQKFLSKLYRPWQYQAIMNAKAVIAPTEAHFSSSKQIPKKYNKELKKIIPFGMDYARFNLTPEISQQANNIREHVAKNKFIVFALGRHVEYKGYNVLLEALVLTDAHLILGGEGPLTETLKSQASELGIKERVTFTGRLSDNDAVSFYHACDIFCLPSITQNEAFGLAQLEAMSCEKPVICSQLNNGVNILNVNNVTGLTVEPNNSEKLANAINLLASDSALRLTLGKSGKSRARTEFSLDIMCALHKELYLTICSKPTY